MKALREKKVIDSVLHVHHTALIHKLHRRITRLKAAACSKEVLRNSSAAINKTAEKGFCSGFCRTFLKPASVKAVKFPNEDSLTH